MKRLTPHLTRRARWDYPSGLVSLLMGLVSESQWREAGSLVVKFYGWKVAPIARNPGGFVPAGGLPGLPEG